MDAPQRHVHAQAPDAAATTPPDDDGTRDPPRDPRAAHGPKRDAPQRGIMGPAEPTALAPADVPRSTAEAPGKPLAARALFQTRGAGFGGPREAYLAMNWFDFLAQGTDSSIIFLYLDYYRYAGWIDDDAHDWLYRLARGVATPRRDAEWSDYGADASRLSDRHLRNLRFLDKLFGTTLQHGEADYLQQTLDMLLED